MANELFFFFFVVGSSNSSSHLQEAIDLEQESNPLLTM